MSTANQMVNLAELAFKAGTGVSCLHFNREDVIFRQGDEADHFYYLLSGQVRLSVVSDNGKEAIISL